MNKKTLCSLIVFLIIFQTIFLSGCWDSRELENLFVVTGIAIDKVDSQQIELTMQVAKTQACKGSLMGSMEAGPTSINISQIENSVLSAFLEINKNSSRTHIVDHNQILLFGQSLAEQGIKDHLDIFIREQEARIEVPVIIVANGQAKDVFSATFKENNLTSLYCSKLLDGLRKFSKQLRIRILDLMQRLLFDNYALAIPMVELITNENNQMLEYKGVALLKNGIMVGQLNKMETLGYLLASDDLSNEIIQVETDAGMANLRIQKSKVKPEIKKYGEKFVFSLELECVLGLEELIGFSSIEPKVLIKELNSLAQQKINQIVNQTITKTQSFKTDVFGCGLFVYRNNPSIWEQVKNDWDDYFSQMEIQIQTKVIIPSTGDIVKSIDIEKQMN